MWMWSKQGGRTRTGLAVAALALMLGGCPAQDPGTWETVAAGLDEAVLSISGTAANYVWAVGADRGKGPLVLHYDGSGWTRVPTGTSGDLWWIATVPGGPTFLAGKSATILRYDGQSFTRMKTPGLAAHTIFGLWARAANDVWAVGSGNEGGGIARWNGSAWSVLLRRVPDGLHDVWGSGANDIWAVGGNGVTFHWDGAAWTRVASSTTERLSGVWGSRANDVWAVGSNGVIVHWNGSTWTSVDSGTHQNLSAVWGAGADHVWAVGSEGTILHYRP